MNQNIKQGLISMAFVIGFIILIGAGLFAITTGVHVVKKVACDNYAKVTGEPTVYIWYDSCYVPKAKWREEIYSKDFAGKYERHY